MAKVKLISGFVAMAMLKALDIVLSRIKQIKSEYARNGLTVIVMQLRGLIMVLSDADPNNDEQIKALFKKFANTDLADYAQSSILSLLDKIKSTLVKRPLSYLAVPIIDMLRYYTDDNPNNDAQVEARWKAVLADSNFHVIILDDLLEPALDGTGMDDEWKSFILDMIKEALESVGNGGKLTTEQKTALIVAYNAKLEKYKAAA
jgi:hypothetical protein